MLEPLLQSLCHDVTKCNFFRNFSKSSFYFNDLEKSRSHIGFTIAFQTALQLKR